MPTSQEIRQQRATLVQQARAILDKAEKEKRDLTAEEQSNWDKAHADADNLKAQIDRQERQEKADLEMRTALPTQAGGQQNGGAQEPGGGPDSQDSEKRAKLETEAFRSWLVYGVAGLTPEHRAVMAKRANLPKEARALAAGIDTAGGYAVAETLVPRIETALKAFAGVRNTRATVLRTTGLEDIQMPTSNDTSNKGQLLAENVAAAEQDLTLGSKRLGAYLFSSKVLRVSEQFLLSVFANVETWLVDRLSERIGRALATYFITGSGSGQPEGLANSTTLGKQGASTTAITYDEVVDLEHSVDPAYRLQAEFLLGDGTLKALKKLKSGDGEPLWVPGMAVREPDTLLRYRYSIDQEIPAPAASAITAYFGDFSKFTIRDGSTPIVKRMVERYGEFFQVGFVMGSFHDSILLDAGTNPIKHFKQSA